MKYKNNSRKTIESGLKNLYPEELQGNVLRRFNVMLNMICGLVDSQHVSSGKIADNQSSTIQSLSIVKRNDRWLENNRTGDPVG